MTEEDLGTYEMLWDCSSCETPKLLGLTHRYCPNCGSAQDPERRYFPDEGEGILVADHAYCGRDKICPACETPNAANVQHCTSCGCGVADGKSVAVRETQEATEDESFSSDSAKSAKTDFKSQKNNTDEPEDSTDEKSGLKKGLIIGAAVLAVLVVIAVIFMNWTSEVSAEVTDRTWTRTIEVERFKAVSDTAWKESVPVRAYSVFCSPEKRGTKKVEDGETCTTKRKDKGNGTYKKVRVCKPKYKSVPTYADRCRYKIDKWASIRKIKATQADAAEPTWPVVNLARTGQCLGCERKGKRKEVYKIHFKLPEKNDASCDLEQEKWASMKKGSKWKAKIRVMDGGLICDELQAM